MVIDALRLAEGVFATSSGGPGTEATVKMRGAAAKHTMVLIDGVIVNSPTTGVYDFRESDDGKYRPHRNRSRSPKHAVRVRCHGRSHQYFYQARGRQVHVKCVR